MCLILIVAGFWFIQGQLYATMTQYILRLQGDEARPEWLANEGTNFGSEPSCPSVTRAGQ